MNTDSVSYVLEIVIRVLCSFLIMQGIVCRNSCLLKFAVCSTLYRTLILSKLVFITLLQLEHQQTETDV